MTFTDAKASGKRAKRAGWRYFHSIDYTEFQCTVRDFLAEDWILEPESAKVWTPTLYQWYFMLDSGDTPTVHETQWADDDVDKRRLTNYTVFETESEALQVSNFQRVQRKLLAFAKVLNGEWRADWTSQGSKWFIFYDHEASRFVCWETYWTSAGEVFFKSKEVAVLALSQLTEEEKEVLIKGMQ